VVWSYPDVHGGVCGGCVAGQALLTASTAVGAVETVATCASKGMGRRCAASAAGTAVGALLPTGRLVGADTMLQAGA